MLFPSLQRGEFMQININGKEIELNFGIRFVRELDEKYNIVVSGKKFGVGIEETIPRILMGNVLALEDVLYAATWTAKKRPTLSEMDDFMDSVEDIDALFEEVVEELKKQNATKKRALSAVAEIATGEAEINETKKKLEQTEKILKKNMKN